MTCTALRRSASASNMRRGLLRFFFSSRRRHTRWPRDWSSDVCSSDLLESGGGDIYIAGTHLNEAMHGDRVVVRIERIKDGGRAEGRIIRILERSNQWLVRSEERRVGKEWRSRRTRYHLKTKRDHEGKL